MAGRLADKRTQVLWVHSSIDDMTNLSPNAMRVYMHLVRRANGSGVAWPGLQSIGDHCFTTVYKHPDSRRKHAIAALNELVEAQLIRKVKRVGKDGQESNEYHLLDPAAVTVESQLAVTVESPTPVTAESHEGNPSEGNPIKENNDDGTRAYGAIIKAWESNIGVVAQHIGEQLAALLDEVGPNSVIHGIHAATEANVRTYRYVQKCARNHAAGVEPPHKERLKPSGGDYRPPRSPNRGLNAAMDYMREKGMLDGCN